MPTLNHPHIPPDIGLGQSADLYFAMFMALLQAGLIQQLNDD